MTKLTLGFIGLGLMGGPMATRLLEAGYELHVWNRARPKLKALQDKGAKGCASPAEVASAADLIFICLTDGTAVEQVILGPRGVAEGGSKGKLVVDFSTIAPKVTQVVAGKLYERCAVAWVDAPVSGGVPGAEQGTLAIMCGGEEDHIARIGPVLDHLAHRVTPMGPLGSGQIAKLCNQLIVSTNILAIAEAITLGRKSGINVQKLPEALAGGFADSLPLQIFGTRMAAMNSEPKISAVNTMLKDVDSIVSLCEQANLEACLIQSARKIYRGAAEAGLAEEDLSRLTEYYGGI